MNVGVADATTTARGFAALAAVVVAIALLRLYGVLPSTGGTLFALGFLVLAGSVAGQLAALARLPRITGYLAAGVLAGPRGFGLFGEREVSELGLVNGLALALIALSAGAELTTASLRRAWRSIAASVVVQSLVVVPVAAAAFWLVAPSISFMAGRSAPTLVAVAALWGVLSLARSPSVTLAVLQETKAKGPLASHALGVIIALDLVVLILFALALSYVGSVAADVPLDTDDVRHLGGELFASVAAGTTFGLLIALYFGAVRIERMLFLVVVGYAITAFTRWFGYETLLVFVVAGFVVMNLTRLGPQLLQTTEEVGAAVMVVFFATVGASLDLDALRVLWPVVLALAAARMAATFVATRVAGRLAGDPPLVRRWSALAFTSQAGVGIALATIVRERVPDVGPELASLAVGVIAINELFGPAGLKLALARAGELPPRST